MKKSSDNFSTSGSTSTRFSLTNLNTHIDNASNFSSDPSIPQLDGSLPATSPYQQQPPIQPQPAVLPTDKYILGLCTSQETSKRRKEREKDLEDFTKMIQRSFDP